MSHALKIQDQQIRKSMVEFGTVCREVVLFGLRLL